MFIFNKFFAVSAVIITMLEAENAHSQTFLTEGLIAYYPFNGNANDSSGNANNGTVVGAMLSTNRFGLMNSAYNFNGLDNYISFSSIPTTQIDNLTITAWVKPATTNQYSAAVCLGYDDGNDGNGFALGMAGDKYFPGNRLSGLLGGVTWFDSGFAYPSIDVWYHVVMTRRDGVAGYYLNGVQAPGTSSRTPRAPTVFTIGSASGIRFFNGSIDDVRIYNRALSTSEIQQLYLYEAGPTVNLVKAVKPASDLNIWANQASSSTVTDIRKDDVRIYSPAHSTSEIQQLYLETAPIVSLVKAVKPAFTQLTVGTNYQLQISSDLTYWANQGSPFTATNSSMVYPQYFDVQNWDQLFFRLH